MRCFSCALLAASTACQSTTAAPSGGAVSDAGDAGAAGWHVRVIDQEWAGSGQVSAMMDPADTPHFAYSAVATTPRGGSMGVVRHAWLEAGELRVEQVDGSGRGLNKAWVLGSDEPRLVYDHIEYTGANFQAVWLAPDQWNVEVNTVVEVSAAASAVWQDGRLRMAYLTAVRGADHPDYEPGSLYRQGVVFDGQALPEEWTKIIYTPVSKELAFQIDSAGTTHIAYATPPDDFNQYPGHPDGLPPYQLRYTTVRDGVWSAPELLTPSPGQYSGLAMKVDAGDSLHVTFTEVGVALQPEEDVTRINEIVYLHRAAGAASWEREIVPGTGPAAVARGALAVSPNGVVHLAYCTVATPGSGCNGIRYAEKAAGQWSQEEIQPGCEHTGAQAALAVGSDGRVHVAYQGCEFLQLVYATREARAE
jgi:hypothetical protein